MAMIISFEFVQLNKKKKKKKSLDLTKCNNNKDAAGWILEARNCWRFGNKLLVVNPWVIFVSSMINNERRRFCRDSKPR